MAYNKVRAAILMAAILCALYSTRLVNKPRGIGGSMAQPFSEKYVFSQRTGGATQTLGN